MKDSLLAHFDETSVAAALHGHHQRLQRHGDLAGWRQAQARLPAVATGWRFESGRLVAGSDAPDHEALTDTLQSFIPWRKGPLKLAGVSIDTEWRSDLKWLRIRDRIDLAEKRVLDVGAGNGYFGWAMLDAGARLVVGCDPTQLFVAQHEVIRHFSGPCANHLLALRLEDLPPGLDAFDVVFSMGVLYHRRDHLAHLTDLSKRLVVGGELVLETLIIAGQDRQVLVPEGRYANMRNVHALPTISALSGWLAEAGFTDIAEVDITRTTSQEQRRTDWMPFHSLPEALDPDDDSRTREGHPAPLRAIVKARHGT
jgi:tRNA (mo5U34)-methyltransferase